MPTKDEDLTLVSLLSVHPADALPYFRLSFFNDLFPTRKLAAKWVFDYWEQNKQLPKLALLKKHYPAVVTLQAAEPLAYCFGLLKQQYIDAVAAGAGEKMTDALDKRDIQEFLKHNGKLNDLISAVEKPLGATADDTDNYVEQLGHEIDKDQNLAMKMMPTRFAPLDEEDGGGMRPGHIYVLASLVNLGKTYVSLQIAENVRDEGFRVLYISTEMPKGDLMKRALAVRFHLDADQFIKRIQPQASKDKGEDIGVWYKGFLQGVQAKIDADTPKGKLFVRGNDEGFLTPRQIAADIKELGVDAVVIDAAQDMRDSNLTKDRTPALYNAVTELNTLIKTMNVALLVTVQLDPDVEKKGLTQGNLNRIQWAQVFAQKAHVAMTMLGSRDSDFRDMCIEKTRDGKAGRKFWLTFKFPEVSIIATTKTPGNLADLDPAQPAETVSELEKALSGMAAPADPRSMPPAATTAPRSPPTRKTAEPPQAAAASEPEEGPSPYERKQAAKLKAKKLPWKKSHGK